MHRAHVIQLGVALAGAAVFAQGALAWGEQKNEPPFTRHVSQARTVAAAEQGMPTDVRGEQKNQLPFTRRVAP